MEKDFPFPPPIQRETSSRGAYESFGKTVSIVGLAYGPAQAPELTSKGRNFGGNRVVGHFFPDRSYALAIHMKVKISKIVGSISWSETELMRIKNVDGDKELPSNLILSGFLEAGSVPVELKNVLSTEYWAFFPVLASEREFLFEWGDEAPKKFQIVIKGGNLVLNNLSDPPPSVDIVETVHELTGKIGTRERILFKLTIKGTSISGTEVSQPEGKKFTLVGKVDSAGKFEIKEMNSKSAKTGLIKGTFSKDFSKMQGYFSRPDGTGLQPLDARTKLKYAAISLTIPKNLKIRAGLIGYRESEQAMPIVELKSGVFQDGNLKLELFLKEKKGSESPIGTIKVTPGPSYCPDCGVKVGDSSTGQEREVFVPLTSGMDMLLIKDKGTVIFSESFFKMAADDLRSAIKSHSNQLPAKITGLDQNLEDLAFLSQADIILKECSSVLAVNRDYCEEMASLVRAVL